VNDAERILRRIILTLHMTQTFPNEDPKTTKMPYRKNYSTHSLGRAAPPLGTPIIVRDACMWDDSPFSVGLYAGAGEWDDDGKINPSFECQGLVRALDGEGTCRVANASFIALFGMRHEELLYGDALAAWLLVKEAYGLHHEDFDGSWDAPRIRVTTVDNLLKPERVLVHTTPKFGGGRTDTRVQGFDMHWPLVRTSEDDALDALKRGWESFQGLGGWKDTFFNVWYDGTGRWAGKPYGTKSFDVRDVKEFVTFDFAPRRVVVVTADTEHEVQCPNAGYVERARGVYETCCKAWGIEPK